VHLVGFITKKLYRPCVSFEYMLFMYAYVVAAARKSEEKPFHTQLPTDKQPQILCVHPSSSGCVTYMPKQVSNRKMTLDFQRDPDTNTYHNASINL
jgi:hypothetical protein